VGLWTVTFKQAIDTSTLNSRANEPLGKLYQQRKPLNALTVLHYWSDIWPQNSTQNPTGLIADEKFELFGKVYNFRFNKDGKTRQGG